MPEITEDVTALQDLPELAPQGHGHDSDCELITCVVTCLLTIA